MGNIFISYSHRDNDFIVDLQSTLIQFIPEIRSGRFEIWSDHQLEIGDDWVNRIAQEVEDAKIIITIISQNFLDSKFIQEVELPFIWRNTTALIMPVLYSHCTYSEHEWLSKINICKCAEFPFDKVDNTALKVGLSLFAYQLKDKIKSHMPEYSISVNSNQGKERPSDYFISSDIYMNVRSKVFNYSGTDHDFLYVNAPSGYGKSTLISTILRDSINMKFKWVDLLHSYNIEDYSTYTILIFDNIDTLIYNEETGNVDSSYARKLIDKHRDILFSSCKKVFLTNRETTYQTLKNLLHDNQVHDNIIQLKGFSNDDCDLFLRSSVNPHYLEEFNISSYSSMINDKIKGCPLMWQLISDLINDESWPELQKLINSKSIELSKLYKLWLDKEVVEHHPLSKDVSYLLSCHSTLGLSINAMAEILDEDVLEVKKAIKPLINKGFLEKIIPSDHAWSPISLLKDACSEDSTLDANRINKNYKHYLLKHLKNESSVHPNDVLSLLDAWIAGVRQTFLDSFDGLLVSNEDKFFLRYNELFVQIEKVLLNSNILFNEKILLNMFKGIVDRPCYELIPIARVLRCLPSKNAHLGDVMWSVVENDNSTDYYSKAECMMAACYHWSQTEQASENGTHKINCRMEKLLDRQFSGYDNVAIELELGAVIGGLYLLNKINWAYKAIMENSIFFTDFPDAVYTFILINIKTDINHVQHIIPLWNQTRITPLRPFIESYMIAMGHNVNFARNTNGILSFNYNRVAVFSGFARSDDFLSWVNSRFIELKRVNEITYELQSDHLYN